MRTRGQHKCLMAMGFAASFGLVISGLSFAHDGSHAAAAASDQGNASLFIKENDAAMAKMMQDMAVTTTGNIDRDFVAMMIPHHQGAIDMAQAQLRYGRNEQLRRLAQEIIVAQMQEIAAMRLAVGERLPPSRPAPTQSGDAVLAPPAAAAHDHTTMSPMRNN